MKDIEKLLQTYYRRCVLGSIMEALRDLYIYAYKKGMTDCEEAEEKKREKETSEN